MKRNQLLALGLATALIAVLAIGANLRAHKQQATTAEALVYPQLQSRLNNVDRIEIQDAGAKPVHLQRKNDRWQVVERSGYSADLGQLRQRLLALAQLKTVEAKTTDPRNYARLGLQDIDKAGSKAQRVQMWAGDKKLADLLIGKSALGGSYIRRSGEKDTWLTSATVRFPSQPQDWLVKDLADIAGNRLHKIVIDQAGKPAYALVKETPGDAQFKLQSPPAGKNVKPAELVRVGEALDNLQLTDVMGDDQAPKSDVPWNTSRFETFDGLVLEARSRTVANQHLITLSAHFDTDLAKKFAKAQSVTKAGKNAQDPANQDPEKQVQAEAEKLQARYKGWTFVIPSYRADTLALSEDQLFEQPKKAMKKEKR